MSHVNRVVAPRILAAFAFLAPFVWSIFHEPLITLSTDHHILCTYFDAAHALLHLAFGSNEHDYWSVLPMVSAGVGVLAGVLSAGSRWHAIAIVSFVNAVFWAMMIPVEGLIDFGSSFGGKHSPAVIVPVCILAVASLFMTLVAELRHLPAGREGGQC